MPRIGEKHGDSKSRGLPGCVIAQRLLCEGVQLALCGIALDLFIPKRPVKIEKPSPKLARSSPDNALICCSIDSTSPMKLHSRN